MKKNIGKIKLFNTNFVNVNLKAACDILEDEILRKEKFVYAAVKDIALTVRSLEDRFLKSFYNKCNYIFVDGRGILYASWLLGKPLKEMVGGPRIYSEMLKRANDKGYKVYLCGTKKEILIKAISNIKGRYPKINIVGFHDGYFDLENSDGLVDEINRIEPEILFIGISTPKREQFIEKYRNKLINLLCIAVGGVFDNEAGVTKYAPNIIGIVGLEWAYRVLQEPRRLLKRYLYTRLKFVYYFLLEIFRLL